MPLHLLGKKSWNVYGTENIAKVRRDEAEAQAKEEAEERRMHEADSEARLHRMRNGSPRSAETNRLQSAQSVPEELVSGADRGRKRRRLAAEDDTDRDIRLAKTKAVVQQPMGVRHHRTSNAPIVDHQGHIDLFPEHRSRLTGKNEEAEAEKAKARKASEDLYTMRLSNAAGLKANSNTPWYTTSQRLDSATDTVATDVWGREDPGRRRREQDRINSTDPLAAMRKGVKQLREAENHRKKWMAQRERDLYEVELLAQQQIGRRKRSPSNDSLENFALDNGYSEMGHKHKQRSHRDKGVDKSHGHGHSNRRGHQHHRREHSRISLACVADPFF